MFKKHKDALFQKYTENETLYNALFFIGGVLFDIFTLDEIDSFFSIAQQALYIGIIGVFLYFDLIQKHASFKIYKHFEKIWDYRDLAVHFLLGALLSVYSIFFIKSASLFSSFGFIAFMLGILVANELPFVQKQKVSLKIGLYFICIFSFFSMIYPVALGHVGKIPFLLSLFSTTFFLFLFYKAVKRRLDNEKALRKALLLPSTAILVLFLSFYFLGWIPPVPLSVKEIGIYHDIKRSDEGDYLLYYERPNWKFWQSGDQSFKAFLDDKVFVFVRIFSPARFNDTLYLHWQKHLENKGWETTDKVPINISGGRKEGYRGYSYKENYSSGDWRILVETNDGREVGRINFDITGNSNSLDLKNYKVIKR